MVPLLREMQLIAGLAVVSSKGRDIGRNGFSAEVTLGSVAFRCGCKIKFSRCDHEELLERFLVGAKNVARGTPHADAPQRFAKTLNFYLGLRVRAEPVRHFSM